MSASGDELSALVLQGGGALGSYQAGAYEALLAAGQKIDWVAAISIGAVNGAIICGNPPERRVEQLTKFWRETSSLITAAPVNDEELVLQLFDETSAAITAACGAPGFFRPRLPPALPGFRHAPERLSVYDTAPLRETLLSLVDFDLLNSGATRYSIGAVNVKTGNFHYFDTARERIGPEHVMASGALPPGLPMIEIEGERYWDGGLVSNTPLQYVLDYERPRRDMLVFQLDLFSARGELPQTLLEVASREKDIRYSSRTRMNTDLMCRLHALSAAIARLGPKAPKELREDPDWRILNEAAHENTTTIVHLIHRPAPGEGPAKDFEFSRCTMERNWIDGKRDVEKTLSRPEWRERARAPGGAVTLDLTEDAEGTEHSCARGDGS
ncbi:patatin-like phospholipase family protein [Methylosinus sp. Sm6]|uniref:patatin-like phospholipase family protein n=1 Tax=Methylosinus sp. Sm6 TaxID=2866948 RepID=UPI001C992C54|nr:patatin-like phospholipase family protein [Methylosinus sp. Sm6]MBY6243048.1 patatin-like phospholipase family protein [Methylosinus sp. Sm6]